jgi:phosphoglycolate phosphatase
MNVLHTRPQAILFDWDNTLVESWAIIQAAMNVTLSAMGHVPWDLDETKRLVARSLKDSFPALFGPRWPEARDIFYREYKALHLDLTKPVDGAAQMLEGLCAAGLRLGVVSNKNGALLRREAAHLGWDGWFCRLVGATDAAADKPAADPVLMALEAMNTAPGPHVWFVGDAEIDMECARNTGCVAILLRDEPWRVGEFERYPPLVHFSKCGELLAHVCESAVP